MIQSWATLLVSQLEQRETWLDHWPTEWSGKRWGAVSTANGYCVPEWTNGELGVFSKMAF